MSDVPIAEVLQFLHFELKLGNIVIIFCPTNSNHIGPRVAKTPSSFFIVISVVTKTQPAKFILAVFAGHVHASLILFDATFALGTRLCVNFYPVFRVIFLVATHAVKPVLQEFTVDGCMSRLQALKAEVFLAVTKAVNWTSMFHLYDAIAIFTGTPLC